MPSSTKDAIQALEENLFEEQDLVCVKDTSLYLSDKL